MGETLSTLKFASRVKTIRNSVVVNAMNLSGSNANEVYLLKQNQKLKEEIEELKRRLQGQSTSSSQVDEQITQFLLSNNDTLETKYTKLLKNIEELEGKHRDQHYSNLMVRKIMIKCEKY